MTLASPTLPRRCPRCSGSLLFDGAEVSCLACGAVAWAQPSRPARTRAQAPLRAHNRPYTPAERERLRQAALKRWQTRGHPSREHVYDLVVSAAAPITVGA